MIGRRGIFTTTAILLAFTTANLSQLQAAAKLPFGNGTYVTDPALCSMSLSAIMDRYKDRIGLMTYNIRGSRLDNNYEMQCEVANVRTSGKKVRFDVYCETEGGTDTGEETWTIVDKNSFKSGKSLYTSCGRFLD